MPRRKYLGSLSRQEIADTLEMLRIATDDIDFDDFEDEAKARALVVETINQVSDALGIGRVTAKDRSGT